MKSMKKGLTINQKQGLTGWFFLLPATILIFAMNFYPMLQALILSFKTGIGNNQTWGGLSNYARLLQDKVFHTAIINNFFYLIIQVPVMLILAIILATVLNKKDLKCKGLFRTMIFLPCCTALVSYSIIFKTLFAYDGYINTVLLNLGLISERINWLGQVSTAKVIIIIALIWRWTGYNMVFYLAGLQNIDESLYEAARIDGAGPIKAFFKITVPLLRPTILLTTIMSINGTLQLFDESVNLTNGGPANSTLTMSHYIYKASFEYNPQFGYAAAMSYVIFILVAVLSFIQMKVGDKR
ncbi:MAG: sugar ABC transporter permease [Lachnospiraceae bacterium]|nr:sugar ABC transporter permease [Lachnospiraceae bacterium]MEE0920120.1 sugar ABC transporter permease [Lachnospiraceae bacterium]